MCIVLRKLSRQLPNKNQKIGPQCIRERNQYYFYSNQPDCNLFCNMSKEDQKKVRQVRHLQCTVT